MLKTWTFISRHPLTRDRPIAALGRFARWQIESRLRTDVEVAWLEGAKLVVRNGMTGATGNIYCGLHEFADMAFVQHLLRPGDLFVDAGANIGSYTILASAVCGADTIAIEPDPATLASLQRNVAINGIEGRVTGVECALGAVPGMVRFTVGRDTVNRVAVTGDRNTREVKVATLDELVADRSPVLIKLDVEGYEKEVIRGASATLRAPSLLAIESESDDPAVVEEITGAGFHQAFYDPFERTFIEAPKWETNNSLFVRDIDAVVERVRSAPIRTVLGWNV